MKGNQMVDCLACAGPAALGGGCATCNGTTEVTQDVNDVFLAQQAIQNELNQLRATINDALFSVGNPQELKQALTEIVTN